MWILESINERYFVESSIDVLAEFRFSLRLNPFSHKSAKNSYDVNGVGIDSFLS